MVLGELWYFNGPFHTLNVKTIDPTVVDAFTARRHEYSYHINPAVLAVAGMIEKLESTGFESVGSCRAECASVSMKVANEFAKALRRTQANENK